MVRAVSVAFALLLGGCNLETTPLPGLPARDDFGDGDADGDGDGDGDADADSDADGDADGDADADADADADGDTDADGDADPAVCGDGVVEGEEGCDEGGANARVPAYLVTHGERSFRPSPILEEGSSVEFYGEGGTCHSNTGYEVDGRVALMLYQESDTGQRSLVLTLGGDEDGARGGADVDIVGFERDDVVLLSDDVWDCNGAGDELYWAGDGEVHGRFGWNTGLGDGGVVRLDCPLTVTITVGNLNDIDTLVWIDGDGTVKDIDFGDPVVVDCRTDAPVCRDDCTPPTCGDGYLDPGEECDATPGCPADCDA